MPTTRQDGTRPPAAPQAMDPLQVCLYGTTAVQAMDKSKNPSFTMFIRVEGEYGVICTQLTMVVLSTQHPKNLEFTNQKPHAHLLAYKIVFTEPNLYMSMWFAGKIKPDFHLDDDRHLVPRGFHLDVRNMQNECRKWLEVSLWRTVAHDLDTESQPALPSSPHVHDQQHYGSEIAPDSFFQVYDKIISLCESRWWKQHA